PVWIDLTAGFPSTFHADAMPSSLAVTIREPSLVHRAMLTAFAWCMLANVAPVAANHTHAFATVSVPEPFVSGDSSWLALATRVPSGENRADTTAPRWQSDVATGLCPSPPASH